MFFTSALYVFLFGGVRREEKGRNQLVFFKILCLFPLIYKFMHQFIDIEIGMKKISIIITMCLITFLQSTHEGTNEDGI